MKKNFGKALDSLNLFKLQNRLVYEEAFNKEHISSNKEDSLVVKHDVVDLSASTGGQRPFETSSSNNVSYVNGKQEDCNYRSNAKSN